MHFNIFLSFNDYFNISCFFIMFCFDVLCNIDFFITFNLLYNLNLIKKQSSLWTSEASSHFCLDCLEFVCLFMWDIFHDNFWTRQSIVVKLGMRLHTFTLYNRILFETDLKNMGVESKNVEAVSYTHLCTP